MSLRATNHGRRDRIRNMDDFHRLSVRMAGPMALYSAGNMMDMVQWTGEQIQGALQWFDQYEQRMRAGRERLANEAHRESNGPYNLPERHSNPMYNQPALPAPEPQLQITSGSESNMPGGDNTHGDGADAVDDTFNRDQENAHTQKMVAAKLWQQVPRIYDDEIIVRMPLCLTGETAALGQTGIPWFTTLAAAGPPVVPAVGYMTRMACVLNDIFVPYPNETTFKPRGYSWYSQLYNYYQVLETRWTYHTVSINDAVQTEVSDAITATNHVPVRLYAGVSDNSHTAFTDARGIQEIGHTNGASKSVIIHGPKQIDQWQGRTGDVTNTITFQGTWTPAKFDDLQIDITRNAMTATGNSPNWKNYLDLGYINFNTAQSALKDNNFATQIHLEFLVHWKKVNMTKYALAN